MSRHNKITLEFAEERIKEYFKNYPALEESQTLEEQRQARKDINDGIKPTISGLAYYLGFESVTSFHDYGKKPKFKRLFRRTLLRIVKYWEQGLSAGRSSQGCSSWLQAIAPDTFKPAETQANNAFNIVVIGSDGNKQNLRDIITTASPQSLGKPNAPRIIQPTLNTPRIAVLPKPSKATQQATSTDDTTSPKA